jgi:omega-6 fatty acid desaturase (delta-12 desaturase)
MVADPMSDTVLKSPSPADPQTRLRSLVAAYETPSILRSLYQMATSIGLYIAGCAAMYWSLHISYWLTAALMIPTAGTLVRVFIVQHDCGHGSFFASRGLNDLVGHLCSLLTFAPYFHWRRQHNAHHRHWNNLDRRDDGADIYATCITVSEYRAMTPWGRLGYRMLRHPVVAHVILPPLVFLLLYRIPFDTPKSWVRERRSVYLTDLAVLAVLAAMMAALGFWQVLLVQLPTVSLAGIIGVGLFSLQHRFDGVLWARQGEWNSTNASVQGSSYFRLPRLLQWFTGNIGFHHVHHLSPRVANYRLETCHKAIPALHDVVTTVNWREGFKALRLTLWNEADGRMVRFADVRGLPIVPSVQNTPTLVTDTPAVV